MAINSNLHLFFPWKVKINVLKWFLKNDLPCKLSLQKMPASLYQFLRGEKKDEKMKKVLQEVRHPLKKVISQSSSFLVF